MIQTAEREPALPMHSGIWLKFNTHYDRVEDYPGQEVTDEYIDKLCAKIGVMYDSFVSTFAYYDDFYHDDEPVIIINMI